MKPLVHGHTIKAVLVLRTPKGPRLVMVHEKPRKIDYEQTDGTVWNEIEKFGLPGGKKEPGETFIETVARESTLETGIIIPPELFSEEIVYHGPKKKSQRKGFDTHTEHYYYAELSMSMELRKIEEADEVLEINTFEFGKIPLPAERGKPASDEIPFTRNQLHGLVEVLRIAKGKIEDADEWLAAVEKRAVNFL